MTPLVTAWVRLRLTGRGVLVIGSPRLAHGIRRFVDLDVVRVVSIDHGESPGGWLRSWHTVVLVVGGSETALGALGFRPARLAGVFVAQAIAPLRSNEINADLVSTPPAMPCSSCRFPQFANPALRSFEIKVHFKARSKPDQRRSK